MCSNFLKPSEFYPQCSGLIGGQNHLLFVRKILVRKIFHFYGRLTTRIMVCVVLVCFFFMSCNSWCRHTDNLLYCTRRMFWRMITRRILLVGFVILYVDKHNHYLYWTITHSAHLQKKWSWGWPRIFPRVTLDSNTDSFIVYITKNFVRTINKPCFAHPIQD